jgi:hypothetical protein
MINTELVAVTCRVCLETFHVSIVPSEYVRWQNGECIQNAMPNVSAEDRELLISQTCGACWDLLFPADLLLDFDE